MKLSPTSKELIALHNAINRCETQAEAMRIAARFILMHSKTRNMDTLCMRFSLAICNEAIKDMGK